MAAQLFFKRARLQPFGVTLVCLPVSAVPAGAIVDFVHKVNERLQRGVVDAPTLPPDRKDEFASIIHYGGIQEFSDG